MTSFEDECRQVIRRFLPAGTHLHSLRLAGGGFSEDRIVRVVTAGPVYALRSWQCGNWPRDRVLERHRWLKHLQSHDVPVAVPCSSLEFPSTTILDHAGREWQLEPWLPGQPKNAASMSFDQWKTLMSLLARMHIASSRYQSTEAGQDWFHVRIAPSPALSERRRIIADWNAGKLLQCQKTLHSAPAEFRELSMALISGFLRHSHHIDRELTSLQQTPVPLFPCFRDLWREHVLWEDSQVSGLIDPTAAKADHLSSDLSRLLGSLLGNETLAWEAAIEHYSKVSLLTTIDRQLIRVLDRSSVLLSGLTWISRWRDGSITTSQLPEVMQRMQEFEHRLQTLS